jgi:glycerol-3-phosphate acyltransferase PlsY
MTVRSLAVLVGAFLLGAFPSAYLITRLIARVDIRTLGNGNVGAKNTYESVGRLAGLVVATADVGKGVATVVMARTLGEADGIVRAAGLCAALGHDFSPFLRFRGGQGMAAIVGVFGVLYPWEMAVGLVVLALALAVSHNWDLSCGVAFALFALSLWLTGRTVAEAIYPVFVLPTIGISKLVQAWQARRASNGYAH